MTTIGVAATSTTSTGTSLTTQRSTATTFSGNVSSSRNTSKTTQKPFGIGVSPFIHLTTQHLPSDRPFVRNIGIGVGVGVGGLALAAAGGVVLFMKKRRTLKSRENFRRSFTVQNWPIPVLGILLAVLRNTAASLRCRPGNRPRSPGMS